jgi:hypothetical protein
METTISTWSTELVRQTAREVMELEFSMGTSADDVMENVVEAVIEAQSREMLRNIRDWICAEAEALDGQESDLNEDGVAALLWFARELDEEIPMEVRD